MFEHPLQQNGHEHLQGRRSLHSRHTETTNVKFWCGSHVFKTPSLPRNHIFVSLLVERRVFGDAFFALKNAPKQEKKLPIDYRIAHILTVLFNGLFGQLHNVLALRNVYTKSISNQTKRTGLRSNALCLQGCPRQRRD